MNAAIRRSLAAFVLLVAAGVLLASAHAAELPDFTSIVARNAPTVVHVEASYEGGAEARSMPSRMQPQLPPDMPDIFRRFFGAPDMPRQQVPQERTSLGSGFIISADGYILTNNHVVEGADSVSVRLQDRRTLDAEIVGTDSIYDIALLKVDAKGLPAARLGDSKTLKPGQWVLAIGSPFGFDYTVTQGIVSAVGRNLGAGGGQSYTAFIQTDVPINRGNSGGPLFNLAGQVVGINSQIYSNTGTYAGISFSIPIDVAMDAVNQIKSKGYVSRGRIGVSVQGIDSDKARALKLDSASGALVASVEAGAPAAKAGVEVGDVIVEFDGQRIGMSADLPPMVAATRPGTKVDMKIMRAGKFRTLRITVGEMARDAAAQLGAAATPESGTDALGLVVETLSDDQREALDLKSGQGVVIRDVIGRQARRAGLASGDVILMVGQQKVGSVAAFKAATADVAAGDTVMLLVRSRQGSTGFVTITVPRGEN